MKNAVLSLLFVTILAGCAAVPQEAVPTPSLTVDNAPQPTVTKTPVPTAIKLTRTPMPSLTPTATRILPLQKVLLTSYFDSPTPTFDAAQAMTVTPATAAVCPEVNPDVVFDMDTFLIDKSTEEKIADMLDYLNLGGSIPPVLEKQGFLYGEDGNYGYDIEYYGDLNGDDIPEMLLTFYVSIIPGRLEFIGCKDGKYDSLHTIDLHGSIRVHFLMVEDMNLDGVPEVLLKLTPNINQSWVGYQILAWNGESFHNLVVQTDFDGFNGLDGVWWGDIRMDGLGREYPWDGNSWEIKDLDQNGTLEFIVTGGVATNWDAKNHGPYQPVTQVYMWNGEGFVLDDLQIGPPEYRFQAVHNGDLYTLLHKYDQAEALYKQAINDPNLAWWTDESTEFIHAELHARREQLPTPTLSAPDPDEHPNLAAYAQYRIVLLHLLQGQMGEAEETYKTMLDAYPAGEGGHIFVQLAERLLGEYRASADVRAACAEAMAFAAQHEDEVLQYVGGYHGWQTLEYGIEDVCSFR